MLRLPAQAAPAPLFVCDATWVTKKKKKSVNKKADRTNLRHEPNLDLWMHHCHLLNKMFWNVRVGNLQKSCFFDGNGGRGEQISLHDWIIKRVAVNDDSFCLCK